MMPAHSSGAACRSSKPSGRRYRQASGATACSAKPPSASQPGERADRGTGSRRRGRRSGTARRWPAPRPRRPSCPSSERERARPEADHLAHDLVARGDHAGRRGGRSPSTRCRSVRHTPQAPHPQQDLPGAGHGSRPVDQPQRVRPRASTDPRPRPAPRPSGFERARAGCRATSWSGSPRSPCRPPPPSATARPSPRPSPPGPASARVVPPMVTSTSGLACRFRNQAGWRSSPPYEATTTSRSPSRTGEVSMVERAWPDLRPVVVSIRTGMPPMLPRSRPTAGSEHRLVHRGGRPGPTGPSRWPRGQTTPVPSGPIPPSLLERAANGRRLRDHVLVDPDLTAGFVGGLDGRFQGAAPAVVRPGSTRGGRGRGPGLRRGRGRHRAPGWQHRPRRRRGAAARRGRVSLTRLDALGEVDTAAAQVTVGAGVTLAALQRHVGPQAWPSASIWPRGSRARSAG